MSNTRSSESTFFEMVQWCYKCKCYKCQPDPYLSGYSTVVIQKQWDLVRLDQLAIFGGPAAVRNPEFLFNKIFLALMYF